MASEFTFKGKLLAGTIDCMNYITYVFENIEPSDPDLKYIMCVRFPGWEERNLMIGEEGFVTVRYVTAGEDKWFDSRENKFVPYQKTDIHFLKFVPFVHETELEIIL